MKQIDFRADFALRLRFTSHGSPALVPPLFWTLTLATAQYCTPLTISPGRSEGVTLAADGSAITIALHAHALPPGPLRAVFTLAVPDPHYPGGERDIPLRPDTNIILTASPPDLCPCASGPVDITIPLDAIDPHRGHCHHPDHCGPPGYAYASDDDIRALIDSLR